MEAAAHEQFAQYHYMESPQWAGSHSCMVTGQVCYCINRHALFCSIVNAWSNLKIHSTVSCQQRKLYKIVREGLSIVERRIFLNGCLALSHAVTKSDSIVKRVVQLETERSLGMCYDIA